MRGKKVIINLLGSTSTQIITIICGFIVPRIIIGTYGSDANGLIHSVTQFLGYITLLESGVVGVIRAALYKPLAEKNRNKISSILVATEGFFRKICFTFVIYAGALACVFPFMVDGDDGWLSTFLLVVIIAISTVSQYYFGITNQVLLQADQRRYITETLGALTLALNAVAVFACSQAGASLHVMKLLSSLVYSIRPIVLYIYVKKKYKIDRSAAPDKDALSQRWDGFGHHIAFYLHRNTDVAVLTIFSKISQSFSIAEVSVCAVYYSVVYGIEKLTNILHLSVEAAFGNMLAKKEDSLFRKSFKTYELLSLMLNNFFFTCTAVMIVPFVSVYTQGITDADYIRPTFAYILVLSEMFYCLRKPYNNVTLAAGHFRQTKKGAYLEAGLNIGLSVILVVPLGITGVAIATAVAMGIRTFEFARYLYKNLLQESLLSFFTKLLVNILSCAVTITISRFILPVTMDSYLTLIIYAFIVAGLCGVSVILFNTIFYPKEVKAIFRTASGTIRNFINK